MWRGKGQGQALASQALVCSPSSLPTSAPWSLWVMGRWAGASTLHRQDPPAYSTTVTGCLGTQAVAATAPKEGRDLVVEPSRASAFPGAPRSSPRYSFHHHHCHRPPEVHLARPSPLSCQAPGSLPGGQSPCSPRVPRPYP